MAAFCGELLNKMSKLSEKVLLNLQTILPHYKIWQEHYVFYRGNRLFLDFYLPELLVVVEVQGAQHDKFVRHFHGDAAGYSASKYRDALKKEWAEEYGIKLVEIREADMPLTSAEVFF